MSPRPTFEYELESLKLRVTEMGTRIDTSYVTLFDALDVKDAETIENILKSDRAVNDMERSIEAKCLSLITRQQPVARDLRTVSASLKVVTDMERIGIHISDMAELFVRLQMPCLADFSVSLPQMVEETRKMVHRAVKAFVARDTDAAKEVIAADDRIDALFNRVKEDLVVLLKEEKKTPDDCIDILMVTKYLEKIGDHAVNIGEWGIFQETGTMENTILL